MSYKKDSVCAVYGCNNCKHRKDGKSFFRMPKNPNSLKTWLNACKRKDLDDLLNEKGTDYILNSYTVCSDHFAKKCFRNKNWICRGLWHGSIPTLNLYNVPKKQKEKGRDEIDNNLDKRFPHQTHLKRQEDFTQICSEHDKHTSESGKLFLKKTAVPCVKNSQEESLRNASTLQEDESLDTEPGDGSSSDTVVTQPLASPSQIQPSRPPKRFPQPLQNDVLLTIQNNFKCPSLQNDRSDIFAKNVGVKLRELPKEQRLLAEKIINEVLFEAEMGNLTTSYRLTETNYPHIPERCHSSAMDFPNPFPSVSVETEPGSQEKGAGEMAYTDIDIDLPDIKKECSQYPDS